MVPAVNTKARTCMEVLFNKPSARSGMYELDLPPPKIGTWWTYCDMSQDGGGWTLLAKAVSRAESNNEKDWLRKGNWQDYRIGHR